MKIEFKSIEFSAESDSATVVFNVNGTDDQTSTIQVKNLDKVIESQVKKVMAKALSETASA